LSGGSYDENDTVSAVKKARAGEQQKLNIERIKAEIEAQNEKMAEENLTNNVLNEYKVDEDIETENTGMDEELNDIEDENIEEDVSIDEDKLDEQDIEDSSVEASQNNDDILFDNKQSEIGGLSNKVGTFTDFPEVSQNNTIVEEDKQEG
jgi:hypothetical protein